jgi:hypothetical protein
MKMHEYIKIPKMGEEQNHETEWGTTSRTRTYNNSN